MNGNSNKANNLKVGFTIFFGITVLFIFIILIGTNDFLFAKTFNLYVNIDNTAGLVDGAPVTLGGYKIGDVEKVEFVVVNDRTNIRIKLRIKSEFKDRIRLDSKVRITSIGILGDKFVDVSIGNPTFQAISENSFLEVEPTLSLDNLTKSISPGLNSFNKIMQNIESVTDSISNGRGSVGKLVNNSVTIDELSQTIKKISKVLDSFNNNNGTLQKLLKNDSLYNDLAITLIELREISESINKGSGTLGKLITNDSLYNNLSKSSLNLTRLLAKTESDSTFIGGLINDKKIYSNMNNTILELNKLLKDIKEHPERYVNVSLF